MAKTIAIPIGPVYPGGPCRGIIHVIEKGDTLYKLGQRYHVSVSRIMYANPFVNIYNLQVGDELCIPVRLQQPRTVEESEMVPPETYDEDIDAGMENVQGDRMQRDMWDSD